jgi:hypothetical protein
MTWTAYTQAIDILYAAFNAVVESHAPFDRNSEEALSTLLHAVEHVHSVYDNERPWGRGFIPQGAN